MGRLLTSGSAPFLYYLIRRSISGTCSLALAKLTIGPPDIDSIRVLRGENSRRHAHRDAEASLEIILVYLPERVAEQFGPRGG
jgi:hypothetical protein